MNSHWLTSVPLQCVASCWRELFLSNVRALSLNNVRSIPKVILRCSQLNRLEIRQSNLTHVDSEAMRTLIARHRPALSLSFYNCRGVGQFLQSPLPRDRNLESLRLVGSDLSEARGWIDVLSCPKLKRVAVLPRTWKNVDFFRLSSALSTSKLESITLSVWFLKGKLAGELLSNLVRNLPPTLRDFEVTNIPYQEFGKSWSKLANSLTKYPRLRRARVLRQFPWKRPDTHSDEILVAFVCEILNSASLREVVLNETSNVRRATLNAIVCAMNSLPRFGQNIGLRFIIGPYYIVCRKCRGWNWGDCNAGTQSV